MSLQLQATPKPTSKIELVSMRVEIVGGTKEKYVHDMSTNSLKLLGNLSSALPKNIHYGYVPFTMSDDGDPLDIAVISTKKIEPLQELEVKPIGIMYTHDEKGPDDKIIALDLSDSAYSQSNQISRGQILDDLAPLLISLVLHSKDNHPNKWAHFRFFGKEVEAYQKIIETMENFRTLVRS